MEKWKKKAKISLCITLELKKEGKNKSQQLVFSPTIYLATLKVYTKF